MNITRRTSLTIITLLFYCLSQLTYATTKHATAEPDLAREKRMASEVEETILDGEVISLSANGQSFMALDMAAEGKTKGGIIILHGRGFHPNWADAIQPLRTQLPTQGWRTLSLQMPVLEKTAKYYDYVPLFALAAPRIEAGIRYLKDQGIKKIVLLAHSCGAHMAMDWIRKKGDGMIDAYIGAGMGATDYRQKMAQPFPLDSMTVPVLDIYGEKDYPAVIRMATERKTAIDKVGNPKSRQVIVPAADHYFTDQGDALVERVAAWLDNL